MPLSDMYANVAFSGTQGTTSNTTPVTVVPNPGTGAAPFIVEDGQFSVLNRDTASATIIATMTSPTTIIERVTLASGDKWTCSSKLVVGPGQTLTLELAGVVTTNQLTYNTVFFYMVD